MPKGKCDYAIFTKSHIHLDIFGVDCRYPAKLILIKLVWKCILHWNKVHMSGGNLIKWPHLVIKGTNLCMLNELRL